MASNTRLAGTPALGVDACLVQPGSLSAPRPDPAPGSTRIEFTVPHAAELTLALFDIAGRQVAVLAHGRYEPGRYALSWNGESGDRTRSPGLYLVRLSTPAGTFARRFVLIR